MPALRLILLCLAALLTPESLAHAATVSVDGDVLRITAGPETNVITVGSDLTVRDTGSPSLMVAGPGCLTGSSGRVTCAGVVPTRIVVDLGAGDDVLTHHGTIALQASGGPGNDRITGGSAADELTGDDGEDQLWGGAGADTLDGGAARDRLWGGDGEDLLVGGDGNDDLEGQDGADAADGGPGDDRAWGGRGADRLLGGTGRDLLRGGDDGDELDGGEDDDELHGDGGDDRVAGGGGNDKLRGEDGADRLEGGDGDDELDGHAGDDSMDGGAGNDHLDGDPGNDVLDGAAGDDELWADEGDDVLFGRDGSDKLRGGSGADGLDGGEGNDDLDGHDGNDALTGGAGDDALDGHGGDDRLDAGPGQDRLTGDRGADTLLGGEGDDTLSGGGDGDGLDGGPGADALDGGDGPDRLAGGDGADRLRGGHGDDVLDGGLGPDVVDGDGGQDTIDYGGRTAGVVVTIGAGGADDGEPGEGDDIRGSVDDVIGGAGNDRIVGTGWPQTLDGGPGDDRLEGLDGADTLRGGAGRDILIGGGGHDTIDGGPGDDHLSARDDLRDSVGCGDGRDLAIVDRLDVVSACETARRAVTPPARRPPASDATGVVVPVRAKAGTVTGIRRLVGGGRFVAIPGMPGERIDRRLLPDLRWMIARYKVRITDGLARQGHAPGGEHPLGLAVDIVPGAGGSWSDVDRLARWAEPRQNRPRAPFRWVGYNGDRNHGRGHHLHLSWRHARARAGRPARWVEVLSFRRGRPVRPVRSLASLARRPNAKLGGAPSVRSGLRARRRCRGAAQLRSTARAAGRAFGIRPSVLMAITEVESAFGCNMGPSSAGAIGWTQFLPSTWRMYGMDADGDGKASPYNSVDAIYSSARYLRAHGAPRNYRKALFAYNHAGWYVTKVLARSRRYR